MRKTLTLVIGTVLLSLGLFAQDQNQESALIHFRQRLLKKKADDKVNSGEDSTRTLHLMIAGNIYQTERHIDYAFDNKTGRYNFRNELKYIQPILGLGDITIANLKTSFAGDITNMYCSPDEFALALKYSGINAVMQANLHTANVDKATLKRTRDMMYDFGMYHTGAFVDNFQRNGNFPLIINKKGFRIAVLNYGTIGKRPGISRDFIINEIDKTMLERDLRLARANKPDFTIVYFDWGNNNQDIPSYNEVELAQYAFQLGANMVVGTHPNTPMRIDYVSYQQNGETKEGIAAYSLGNLIGSNEEIRNRNGFIMDVELKKNNYTGDVNLSDWGVIPVYTHYDTSSVSGKIGVYSVACSAVENGDILASLPYIEKRRVINGAYEVRKLLGSVADEIQYNMNEMVCNNVMETIDLTNAALNNKYNVTRKEVIPPSEAPLLPVAVSGSNNPPSLATIYEDKTLTKPDNTVPAYKKEKDKAQNIFVEQSKPVKGYNEQSDLQVTATDLRAERNTATNNTNGATTTVQTSGATTVTPTTGTTTTPATANTGTGIPTTAKQQPSGGTTTTTTVTGTVNTTNQQQNLTTVSGAKETGNTGNPTTATSGNNATVTAKTETNPQGGTAAGNQGTTAVTPVSEKQNTTTTAEGASNPVKTANQGTSATNGTMAATNTSVQQTVNGETGAGKQSAQTTTEDAANAKKQAGNLTDDPSAVKKQNNELVFDDPNSKKGSTTLVTDEQRNAKKSTTLTDDESKQVKKEATERTDGTTMKAETQGLNSLGSTPKVELSTDFSKVEGKNYKLLTDTVFRIQFYALKKYIPLDTNYYTHLKGYEVIEEGGLFKYLLGRYKDLQECEAYWKNQILPRYKTSFIVKYVDGKRILE